MGPTPEERKGRRRAESWIFCSRHGGGSGRGDVHKQEVWKRRLYVLGVISLTPSFSEQKRLAKAAAKEQAKAEKQAASAAAEVEKASLKKEDNNEPKEDEEELDPNVGSS